MLKMEHENLVSELDSSKAILERLEKDIHEAESAQKAAKDHAGEVLRKFESDKVNAFVTLNKQLGETRTMYQSAVAELKEQVLGQLLAAVQRETEEEVGGREPPLEMDSQSLKSSALEGEDIASYKEQLAASFARERELERKLQHQADASTAVADDSSEMKSYKEKTFLQSAEIARLKDEVKELKEAAASSKPDDAQYNSGMPNWSPDSSITGLSLNLNSLTPPFSPSPMVMDGQVRNSVDYKAREVEKENIRLKDVISAMRIEMETVQSQAKSQASKEVIDEELKTSDSELQQALKHISILQEQEPNISEGNNRAELEFLRTRLPVLMQENRRVRREALGSGKVHVLNNSMEDNEGLARNNVSAEAHDNERLYMFARLVDMRNELCKATSSGNVEEQGKDTVNAVNFILEQVSKLVSKLCQGLQQNVVDLRTARGTVMFFLHANMVEML